MKFVGDVALGDFPPYFCRLNRALHPIMTDNQQAFQQYLAHTSEAPLGMEITYAEGIYLYGPEGKKYVDMISGICVSNVGHGAPEIVTAIREQAERYLHTMVYGESIMSPQVQYAQLLHKVLGEGFDQVYFLNGGTEANEAALKVAKKYTGRGKIISCHNSYHGSTHGSLSVSGNPDAKIGYGPLLPDVHHIAFNDFEGLREIDEQTACIIIEAIQGAGGVVLPKEGYLQAVKARCEEVGALMILDEIQTGFGRTGELFAHQTFGVKPDILVLGKALGGGLPMGAFVTRKEVLQVIHKNPILGHINTFGGGPVACAAGKALLEKIIRDELLAQIPQKEALLFQELQHPLVKEIRGKGLMFAILFETPEIGYKLREVVLKKGFLTIGFLSEPNGLRICPPLTITEEEIKMACQLLKDAMDEVGAVL